MKKKLLSLLLTGVLAFGSVGCVNAAELGECVTEFEIEKILHYSNPQEPLVVNITIPQTYTDGLLLVGFYTDGNLTKLEAYDASSNTQFSKIKFQMTYEDGDGLPLTPDEIKLFTWNKNNILPLTISENVLTNEVIETANDYTIRWMLDRILGTGTSTTSVISALKSKIDPPENYPKIIKLLDLMKGAAQKAYNIRTENLLTSEFTKRFLNAELQELKTVVEYIESNEEQKNTLVNAYNTLGRTQKNTINYLFGFFDIEFTL